MLLYPLSVCFMYSRVDRMIVIVLLTVMLAGLLLYGAYVVLGVFR